MTRLASGPSGWSRHAALREPPDPPHHRGAAQTPCAGPFHVAILTLTHTSASLTEEEMMGDSLCAAYAQARETLLQQLAAASFHSGTAFAGRP